ncbi:MAG: glycosyltransferase family 39 protein [Acidobacteriales bacterium]|nr:glycosyltransferase family 39 protein [Terriglobales bacterium]
MPGHSIGRFFWPAVAGLLLIQSFLLVSSALQETQTWDESYHMLAGYSYWKLGRLDINREHPPLGKYLNALPLLFLAPDLPVNGEAWKRSDYVEAGVDFLYHNRVDADTMLFAARCVTMLLTLALGLAIAWWGRRRYGGAAALVALTLFVFDPNILAHGRYVTTDTIAALFIFLGVVTWETWLDSGRRRHLALAGVVFGLAIVSKFSALILVPICVALYALRWRKNKKDFSLARCVKACGLMAALAAVVVIAAYAPEAKLLLPATRAMRQADSSIQTLRDTIDARSEYGELMRWLGGRLGLQAHSFLVGLGAVAAHNTVGQESYLLGKLAEHGWWYYFPVLFAVKTPTATLVGVLIALVAAWRRPRFELLVPVVLYFAASMASGLNIGLRHLLPIYPFLFLLIGATLAAWRLRIGRLALWLLPAALAAESMAVYPHYLAFFNAPAGGPGAGPRYAVDSNIDWGQDIKKLKRWMDARGVPQICLCYFGRANPEYYGIPNVEPPQVNEQENWKRMDCYTAVSVTPLVGVYTPRERFDILRRMEPVAKIGYSIYVYDLRKKRP